MVLTMTRFCSKLILLFVSAIFSDQNTTSLPDDWCPVTPPCSCYGVTIDCGNQNLTTFPTFKVSNIPGKFLFINIDGNFLKTVPENAFANLRVENDTQTTLNLDHNNISHIEANAFNGLEDTITYLRLDSNEFTHIPDELAKLSNLGTLLFRKNPLVALDEVTMESLSKQLNEVHIGMGYFREWPEQLNYLTNLTELDIHDLTLTKLDSNAFGGLNATLKTLSFVNTSLEQIPAAICQLHKMDFFEFYSNNNVQNVHTLFEPCHDNMPAVLTVTLFGNDLRHMPHVFDKFPSMQSLFLSMNQLSSIPLDYVPQEVPLQYLDLQNNSFTRIPAAFQKLTSLTQLQFGYNKLRSIEENDFSAMHGLQYLYLYDNPIEYIASSAFKNNINLYTLALGGTNLRHLPASLVGLTKLHYFTVGDDPIVCNCGMSYLRSWNVTYLRMDGFCESTKIPLRQFILDELPKCP